MSDANDAGAPGGAGHGGLDGNGDMDGGDAADRHLSSEQLEALLPGIPGAPPAGARRHLERCDRCGREAELLAELHAALHRLPEPPLPSGFTRAVMARVRLPVAPRRRLAAAFARGWPAAAAAAVAALAVTGAALWTVAAPAASPAALAGFALERVGALAWSGLLAAARYLWTSGIPDLVAGLASDVELLEAIVAAGSVSLVSLATAVILVRTVRWPAPSPNGAGG